MTIERVAYDELGLFHENAAEYGLPFDEAPVVRREAVEVEPGRSLSALVWGEGDPEVVLLHGGGQNAHTWDTVALALRPRRLLAIDLPGHGHSDGFRTASARPSPTDNARDVAEVVRALAPDAHGVVGMSLGGLTSIALAGVAPELVRKLVLVDVLPGLKSEHAAHIGAFLNGPPTFDSFDDLLQRTMQFNPTRSESSLRRGILHNAVQLDDGSWVWRHSRWRLSGYATIGEAAAAMGEPGEGLYDELQTTLAAIDVPVMLARGMRPDSVLRDEDEAALLEVLPAAQVEHFDQAGHSIQGDMPVELAATIERFIAG